MVETLDPFEARRGRWVLIYGILQVLATVSVDSPNLRYKEGVQYHLGPQMKGVVPWGELGSRPEEEAEHIQSHCWVVPSTWNPAVLKSRPGAHKPIIWGQFGDGRERGESEEHFGSPKPCSCSESEAKLTSTKTSQRGDGEDHIVATKKYPRGEIEDTITSPKKYTRIESEEKIIPPKKHELKHESKFESKRDVKHDLSIGRKRAEEWVASNASQQIETSFEGDLIGSDGDNTGGVSGGNSEGHSNDAAAVAARRRRALVHGFTDFRVPSEW